MREVLSRGGNIGWVMIEKLPRTFREALADLGNGDVTAPILLDGAVYVLRRSGERKDGLVDITQARVWLARAILPINAGLRGRTAGSRRRRVTGHAEY